MQILEGFRLSIMCDKESFRVNKSKLFSLSFLLSFTVFTASEVTIGKHKFSVPEGMDLELVAGPELVKRPVNFCFDEQGVMYVTESSGSSDPVPAQAKNPRNRLLRLIDENGDGIFDKSTVFADKLPFPQGVLYHRGSVYVGAPPTIIKLTDTDGDHVADERSDWFIGTAEKCGNDIHGPYFSPDGYFYWTKGGFEEQNLKLGNGSKLSTRAAHIYRAKPDGSDLEIVITGGMNNPVGLSFTQSGDIFCSGTFFDLSKPGRRDGILHAVYGGLYGRENRRVIAGHAHNGQLLPVLKQMGPAAPSGMNLPKSKSMGLNNSLLCTEFNTRRISRHILSESASSYQVQSSVLIESDQTDFHPTDIIEDADGSLLISDTGNWYKICCPTSTSVSQNATGGIYRLRSKEASKIEDPRGLKLNWDKPQVTYLSDPRPAVVDRAINLLAKEINIEFLVNAKAKVPAIWSLNRIPGKNARKAVRSFLNDSDLEVVSTAIHCVGLWRDGSAVSKLIEILLKEESSHLKRVSASALGRIGDRRSIEALLEVASGNCDEFLKHAITYALFEIGDFQSLPAGLKITEEVNLMLKNSKAKISKMPQIKPAKSIDLSPEIVEKRKIRLKELTTYLPKGDSLRGKALFNNASKSLCISCHTMGDKGIDYAPDLTKIGDIRSKEDLLEAIVYPDSSIARYYEQLIIKTSKGQSSGIFRKHMANKIIMAPGPGAEESILHKDIIEAEYSPSSLMPTIFDGLLTPQEIADIIAYLKQAK